MQTNAHTGTTIDEVAAGIYRINTPLRIDSIPGGFNLSQYLIVDDEPMIFHTGWRRWFPFVSEAISKVIPLDQIRHIGYSHFEGDEAGAMNEFLAVAPHAVPFASHVGLMTSLNDHADREGRGLADGETFSTGKKTWQWIDMHTQPRLAPSWSVSAWECLQRRWCWLAARTRCNPRKRTEGGNDLATSPAKGGWILRRSVPMQKL
jgi:hypothetical protein